MRSLHNSYFFTEAGLFFSSEALGLVFSATYLWGRLTPSALPPYLWIGRPAVSPTDKLRKNSALTPVASEKSTLFSWVTKIVRLCKALEMYFLLFHQGQISQFVSVYDVNFKYFSSLYALVSVVTTTMRPAQGSDISLSSFWIQIFY